MPPLAPRGFNVLLLPMDTLNLFGLFAFTAMLIFYSLEDLGSCWPSPQLVCSDRSNIPVETFWVPSALPS